MSKCESRESYSDFFINVIVFPAEIFYCTC